MNRNGEQSKPKSTDGSSDEMSALTVFSPAKLNLFLAITGRRADGFHDLLSLAAPVAWGDTLTVDGARDFSLECNDPEVPVDGRNLIMKAVQEFRDATGWPGGAHFRLEKNIPIGAGLGGGSSNAAAALRALNFLAGTRLLPPALADIAARIGSDCPLFLFDGPVVMRGRGEQIEPLSVSAAGRLLGREVLIFKPAFSIGTAWAYGEMAKSAPSLYLPVPAAEAKLAAWLSGTDAEQVPTETALGASGGSPLLFNNMEGVAFRKFPALPLMIQHLQREFGLEAHMSGSGSACFALLSKNSPVREITQAIQEAWGHSAIIVHTRFAINPH
jgi:4-diphosphocytidyl-2-C-methyl-D-erythritol kinase